MEEPERCAWASAYQNRDFIHVVTHSGYRASAYDPQGKETILGLDADDNKLGVAVKEALAHSRFLSIDEVPKFLDYRLVAQRYDERIRSLMERKGYKSRTALFNKMKRCSITLSKGVIEISPMIHESLEGWRRNKSDELEEVHIAADRPANEIGAALKLGLSRCVE